jgi:dipeptidyl aminopeptidase/acylaminoacyl peptidase
VSCCHGHLATDGRVDPARVGISGYSRSGIFVAKAITESPERFAAAAIANTAPGSLFDYYAFVDGRSPEDLEFLSQLWEGAKPYGDGLQRWVERAAGFRTDRITAPVLIMAGDPPELLAIWSLYAPLRDQGKPVELQYFRRGQHNLTRPLEVLTHQEMLVDWFDFWLAGHEDGSDGKRGQYQRWREMDKSAGRGKLPN